jgi:tRNA(Ile)-lysidine synthase
MLISIDDFWIERLKHRILQWRAQGLGSVWVVAVSGGGDSVGLLRVLCRLAEPVGLRLSVAHLNHGARGEAARADSSFVAELAGSLGLPFDLGEWGPLRTGHFESDARCGRYTWLTKIARARGASAVAVGHTSDDQAETILHRILRGTGPRGLAGMPFRRLLATDPQLTLVRPLLATPRRAILECLTALGQPLREDHSNADLARTRSRIRYDLLPKLAVEYNPNVADAIERLGGLATSFLRAIEVTLSALVRDAVLAKEPNRVFLKRRVLRSVPGFLRTEVLRRIWRHAGWPEASMSARRWRRLAALSSADQIAWIVVDARVEVSTNQSLLILRRLPVPETSLPFSNSREQSIPLRLPGLTFVSWARCLIDARIDIGHDSQGDGIVDFDRLSGVLSVRAPLRGDRFEPLGMTGKSMPIADFFRARGVPRDRRAVTPLVCDQLGIIWVAGHRVADRVKETEQTRRILSLRLLPGPAQHHHISQV